jgi:hypothetical protein
LPLNWTFGGFEELEPSGVNDRSAASAFVFDCLIKAGLFNAYDLPHPLTLSAMVQNEHRRTSSPDLDYWAQSA